MAVSVAAGAGAAGAGVGAGVDAAGAGAAGVAFVCATDEVAGSATARASARKVERAEVCDIIGGRMARFIRFKSKN